MAGRTRWRHDVDPFLGLLNLILIVVEAESIFRETINGSALEGCKNNMKSHK